MRPTHPPLSSFGWTVAGALALGLSFPPTSFYPLAWVALIPWIVRWRAARSLSSYVREIYAAALVWSCSAGFWLLFHPDAGRALLGGLGILLVPVPMALAFTGALAVRLRFGQTAGMVAIVANVVAVEYLMLHLPGGVPWLLLGHTQASAMAFIQTADLGGVLLVSVWVLLLNLAGSLAVPANASRATPTGQAAATLGERGALAGLIAILVVLPVLYGAARSAAPSAPVGYARMGLVQPGLSPNVWDDQDPAARVETLAGLSTTLLRRWRGTPTSAPDTLPDAALVHGFASGHGGSLGTLIWPQAALPDLGSDDRGSRLLTRLGAWCQREGVDLMAGTTLAHPSGANAATGTPTERRLASAAVLVRDTRAPMRYDQMRRLPLADARTPGGSSRVLFPASGARLATTLGFESVYGDHLRTFAREGADAVVVLAQTGWWGRGGQAQHLAFTRFRAIETRRTVVVAAVSGGSSLVTPTGEVETLAGWMQPALVPLDVPLYREATVYAVHGDWVGRFALWLALGINALLFLVPRLARSIRWGHR